MALRAERDLVRKHLDQARMAAQRFNMLASHNYFRPEERIARYKAEGNQRMLAIMAAEQRLENGLREAASALADMNNAEELKS